MSRRLFLAAAAVLLVPPALAQGPRDGAHDFDFDVGVWKTHIVRRPHPLSGSDESVS